MARSEFAEMAAELASACAAHTAAFKARGYCSDVAAANDRIGSVHDRFSRLTGIRWRDGNERLLAELLRRSGSGKES